MKPDTQERPDFEKAARKFALTLIDEEFVDGSPHLICFDAGANHGYDLSRKRIEELEAYIKLLVDGRTLMRFEKDEVGEPVYSHTALSLKAKELLTHEHTR